MVNSAPILILIFLAVTFIQSGCEKVKNYCYLFSSGVDGGVLVELINCSQNANSRNSYTFKLALNNFNSSQVNVSPYFSFSGLSDSSS